MGRLSDVRSRGSLNRILSYMTSEGCEGSDEPEACDTALEESYDRFFTAIEELYPQADRQNDDLFHAVSQFAAIHDNACFRTGVIVGFRLYKELEEGYSELSGTDLPAALERCGLVGTGMERSQDSRSSGSSGSGNSRHRNETESFLEQFFDARINGALEDSLRQDRRYQSARAGARRKVKRLEDMGLSRRQWTAVDQALSACNGSTSEYGRAAYVLGFQDAVDVIVELQGWP